MNIYINGLFIGLLISIGSNNVFAVDDLPEPDSVDGRVITRAPRCDDTQTAGNVSQILSRIYTIENKLNLILHEIIPLGPQIATMEETLLSAIESIDIVCTGTFDNGPVIREISLLGDELSSKLEDLSLQISINDALILTAIDSMQICSAIDIGSLVVEISIVGDTLSSQIEDLSLQMSINDALILTAIDTIQCSATDLGPVLLEISVGDAMLSSKIGTLDALGTCLDAIINVPEDVNNLNLTIIALLKTILLELRGCPGQ